MRGALARGRLQSGKGGVPGVEGSTRCRAVVALGSFVGVGVAGRRWLVAGSWALGAGRWPHVNVNDGAPAPAWVRGRDRGTVSGERGLDCSKWDCGSSCPAAGAGAESESAASSSAWVGRLRRSALVRPSGGCAAWAVVGVRSAMGVAQDGVHWGSGPVATVLLSAERAFGQQSRVTGGLSSLFDYGGPEVRGKNTARAERHVKGGARWFPGPNSSRGRRRAAGKGPNPWPRVVCVCGYATLRCVRCRSGGARCRAGCWLLAACVLCASLAGPAWLRALAKQNRISALAEEWEGAPPADCPGPGSCLAALTLHASAAASVPRCFWLSPVRCLSPQSHHHIPHKTTSASNISSLIFSGALNSSALRGRPRRCLVAWSGMAGNIILGGLVAGMEGDRPWGMNGWKVLLAAKSTFAASPPWPKGAGPDLALCSSACRRRLVHSAEKPMRWRSSLALSFLSLSLCLSLPARPALSLPWLHWLVLPARCLLGTAQAHLGLAVPWPSQQAAAMMRHSERADEKSGHGQWTTFFLQRQWLVVPSLVTIINPNPSSFGRLLLSRSDQRAHHCRFEWQRLALPTNLSSEQVGFGRYETGGIWRMWAGLNTGRPEGEEQPKESSHMHTLLTQPSIQAHPPAACFTRFRLFVCRQTPRKKNEGHLLLSRTGNHHKNSYWSLASYLHRVDTDG